MLRYASTEKGGGGVMGLPEEGTFGGHSQLVISAVARSSGQMNGRPRRDSCLLNCLQRILLLLRHANTLQIFPAQLALVARIYLSNKRNHRHGQ